MATLAILGSILLTVFVGSCGYITFGDETKANLLNNFSDDDILADLMRILYILTMVLTYPVRILVCVVAARFILVCRDHFIFTSVPWQICFFVCRQVLHNLVSPLDAEGKVPDIRTVSRNRHVSYTMAIFLSNVFIVLLTSNLGVVMSLTVSTCLFCESYHIS